MDMAGFNFIGAFAYGLQHKPLVGFLWNEVVVEAGGYQLSNIFKSQFFSIYKLIIVLTNSISFKYFFCLFQ